MTRRRPSAWPTIVGAFALFGVVFQLMVFQVSPPTSSTLPAAKPSKATHVVVPAQQPAPVVSSTS
jgi:hypothetical protein